MLDEGASGYPWMSRAKEPCLYLATSSISSCIIVCERPKLCGDYSVRLASWMALVEETAIIDLLEKGEQAKEQRVERHSNESQNPL